jgi:hypothetical protein
VWELREEARKGWQHFISNEIVYLSQLSTRHLEISHEFAEQYIHGNCWLEVHMTFGEQHQRYVHFKSIIEAANPEMLRPVFNREMDIEAVPIHRDKTVFVHDPEFIQFPEEIISVGVPSMIRLKAVDNACHCGWEKLEPFRVIGIARTGRGKTDPCFFPFRENPGLVEMGQQPCQLIKGGSETANEIPKVHRNTLGHWPLLNPEDVQLVIKICLLGNDAVVRIIEPLIKFRLKRIEVFLRPSEFHFDVGGSITEVS